MDKQRLKSLLYNYEVRIVSTVVQGVTSRASKRQILGKAWKETVRIRLEPIEQNRMWQFATSFYRHCIAAAGRESKVQKRAEKVYFALKNDLELLEHQKNEIANAIEFRIKNDELRQMLSSESNFFYCTAHENPADGHAAYQDKIYYRRNGHLSDVERKFVNSQRLLAVEDVVMGPVWLCTRRNCRHQLIPISFESAQTGDFRVETKGNEISYEEEQYRNYKDRLKMYIGLKNAFKNTEGVEDIPQQMKLDIRRTYSVCRAWRQKIKKSRS